MSDDPQRRLILHMSVSLDGFVAAPTGSSTGSRRATAAPKVVYSQSLSEVSWSNARLSRAELADEIPALKREPGKDMVVFGGARIANSLMRERLVDEYRLTVHPVVLGDGLGLMLGLPEPQRFELVSATTYTDGCVSKVLQPA